MIHALLFDAAGTLIEPAEPVARTYARILSSFGLSLDPDELGTRFRNAFESAGSPDYGAHAHGDLAERAWWREVVELSVSPDRSLPVSNDAFHAIFDYYAHGRAWRILPEVETVLASAAQAGFRLAVVSNFDLRLHRILDALGLAPHFEHVITSAEAAARKPDPAIFQYALELLGLSPTEVLHIGDRADADVEGARAAGIQGYRLDPPERPIAHALDWAVEQRGK